MLHDFFICLIPQGFVINGAKKATTKANEKITFLTLFQEETSKKWNIQPLPILWKTWFGSCSTLWPTAPMPLCTQWVQWQARCPSRVSRGNVKGCPVGKHLPKPGKPQDSSARHQPHTLWQQKPRKRCSAPSCNTQQVLDSAQLAFASTRHEDPDVEIYRTTGWRCFQAGTWDIHLLYQYQSQTVVCLFVFSFSLLVSWEATATSPAFWPSLVLHLSPQW